ncbi:GLPGLI family protein [Flavobacterium sp. LS1R49]|uniref:GLPGLI family protein n=1 Tax=Flavobacterium shii TaxID=2987687 RepID=A0A9X2ZDV8_9FLAO|nr:GLPGLI family protein [Flavobacterium shii]MCV9929289.1 GLPGLI family protein [Flavobacterium shii]
MEKKILILILFISTISIAQIRDEKVALIEYSLQISSDGYQQKIVTTKCSKSKSVSKTLANNSRSGVKIDENTNSIAVYEKELDTYELVDLTKKTIISIDNIKGVNYKINEVLPVMNWKLSKDTDTKKIDMFICNKAMLNFRGRSYTAWYTPYIPLSFGPWKFYGLPGLILELYDTENNYHWTATKIIYPSKEQFDLEVFEKQNLKETSLIGFVEEIEKQKQLMFARIMKAMPRGATMDSGNDVRTGVELIYDWEVNREK